MKIGARLGRTISSAHYSLSKMSCGRGPKIHEKSLTQKRKVEKLFRRRQNDRNDEGYKRSIDENRGPISKNGFSDQNTAFLAQKICFFLRYAHITHFFGL